jgi:2-succinyl-5-enolpyruvyl-6-hydroxy-3-cyclohexene-1-carboxylate synthase
MGKISDKKGVQQLLQLAKSYGLKKIVVSPGSRNAPLSISFSQSVDFECFVIPDERAAAFYALGMAEQLQEPVAVVCTSGSAVLNYSPAVAEAFYRCIPLVVISADRPAHWIDQGDGQTIRQVGALSNHILAETSLLETPKNATDIAFNHAEIERVFLSCLGAQKGPIHINFPFNEPLYGTIDSTEIEEIKLPIKAVSQSFPLLNEDELSEIKKVWSSTKKKMIICGQLEHQPQLQHILSELSGDSSVAILVENTSNLAHRRFIHCIDRTLNSITENDLENGFKPELLITIGGAVISKKIKSFLRRVDHLTHWKIGMEFPAMDTYQQLTKSYQLDPSTFFRQLIAEQPQLNNSRFGEQWKQLDYLIQEKHETYFHSAPYGDLSVFQYLMDVVPDDSYLHMANSSVVRYCQLFDGLASLRYFCNRGTSGIDGSTSTAIGAAMAKPDTLHTFISGDISFFYDSNALWNQHLPKNIRIIVINNGGGGIFKIIPGPDTSEELDDFFVAKQNYSVEFLCKAFDVNYLSANCLEEIDQQIIPFYSEQANKRPVVMEVFTPHEANDKQLKEYFEKIRIEKSRVKQF